MVGMEFLTFTGSPERNEKFHLLPTLKICFERLPFLFFTLNLHFNC